MATPIERALMYGRALLNVEPSAEQLLAIADAYAFKASQQEIEDAFGVPYEQLTDEQKAIVLLESLKREAQSHMRYAAEQKAVALAAPAIRAAGDAAAGMI